MNQQRFAVESDLNAVKQQNRQLQDQLAKTNAQSNTSEQISGAKLVELENTVRNLEQQLSESRLNVQKLETNEVRLRKSLEEMRTQHRFEYSNVAKQAQGLSKDLAATASEKDLLQNNLSSDLEQVTARMIDQKNGFDNWSKKVLNAMRKLERDSNMAQNKLMQEREYIKNSSVTQIQNQERLLKEQAGRIQQLEVDLRNARN